MPKDNIVPNQREAVLMAILLHGERYGREIRTLYEGRTGQRLPFGSLYVTLDRMEDKGFLRSRLGESDSVRGGNRRKYYKLTAAGVKSLNLVQEWTRAAVRRASVGVR